MPGDDYGPRSRPGVAEPRHQPTPRGSRGICNSWSTTRTRPMAAVTPWTTSLDLRGSVTPARRCRPLAATAAGPSGTRPTCAIGTSGGATGPSPRSATATPPVAEVRRQDQGHAGPTSPGAHARRRTASRVPPPASATPEAMSTTATAAESSVRAAPPPAGTATGAAELRGGGGGASVLVGAGVAGALDGTALGATVGLAVGVGAAAAALASAMPAVATPAATAPAITERRGTRTPRIRRSPGRRPRHLFSCGGRRGCCTRT